MIDWLLNRLRENSTWRGLILLLTAAGVKLTPELQDSIVAVGLSVVGLINIVRKAPNAPDIKTPSNSVPPSPPISANFLQPPSPRD